jgi:methionyl aminopeptidase
MEKEKILQAGKIAKQVKDYIRPLIKHGMPLLEIADKIEARIFELGGKPAFPTNLSINEIAAHYTPSFNDETKAGGLLKVELGVHIDGWVADLAFSIDLENSQENKKLIEAAEHALQSVKKILKPKVSTSEIGKVIENSIREKSCSPIINLSGHSMEEYDLHAGINIPNIAESSGMQLKDGLYAIEPFATSGSGKVKDGKPSGIYSLVDERTPRSDNAREVLNFIIEEYQTLPFCSRWIYKKFGAKGLFGLKQLEDNQNLHQYPQLIEVSKAKVAQAEDTFFLDKEVIITTE